MFILHKILPKLQENFAETSRGKKRATWFTYTLLAIAIPFTSSKTANLLRSLQSLFGFNIISQRYYTFMASPTLPWQKLWKTMWGLIPSPTVDNKILVALDDSINPKSGRQIFGCGFFHNHAPKGKKESYPWSQNIVMVGLLKQVKSRWACIPLSFRFYMMKKDIDNKEKTTLYKGKPVQFETKLKQAAEMLYLIAGFYNKKVVVVTDSWFGNNGLWSLIDEDNEKGDFELLSRLRTNSVLYDKPLAQNSDQNRSRGRPKKYGTRLGSVDECAKKVKEKAKPYAVFLYGKKREVMAYSQVVILKTLKRSVRVVWVFKKTRYIALFTTDMTLSIEQIIEYYGARWKIESGFKELKQDIGSMKAQVRKPDAVINHLNFCLMASTLTWVYAIHLEKAPDRRHKIKGRASFAFSDIRRIMAEAILTPEFNSICPLSVKPPKKSIVTTLLQMVA